MNWLTTEAILQTQLLWLWAWMVILPTKGFAVNRKGRRQLGDGTALIFLGSLRKEGRPTRNQDGGLLPSLYTEKLQQLPSGREGGREEGRGPIVKLNFLGTQRRLGYFAIATALPRNSMCS